MEIGELSHDEQQTIESQCAARGKSMTEALEDATAAMSSLAGCAGVVASPKTDRPLKHVEFVNLGDGQALVVLVNGDGLVENRIIDVPIGTPPSALVEAGNYLNARLIGRTLDEARREILDEIAARRARLDQLASGLVETGLATWTGDVSEGSLIVKGQSKLLNDIEALGDLERVRGLFQALEQHELLIGLLELTGDADGVQIFIGSENTLFSHTGCTMIVAPFSGDQSKIVGAIGVIGPTRINYARIIPIVDYTATVVGRMIG